MDILFEFIFSIIFEGSLELMQEKKVPIWLRIICGIIVISFFLLIISIIGLVALLSWKENIVLSLIFIIIDIIIIAFTIKKIGAFKIKNVK